MFKKIYNSSIILLTILCFSSFMSSCSTEEDNENIESTYHSPEELESYLTAINQEFKEIMSINKQTIMRNLSALRKRDEIEIIVKQSNKPHAGFISYYKLKKE